MNEFTVSEALLSDASGISRDVLRKKRRQLHLQKGVDYNREKNALFLTEPASLRVLTALEVSSPANVLEKLLSDSEAFSKNVKKRAPISGPVRVLQVTSRASVQSGPVVAVVVNLPRNHRIVEAVLEGSGERIRVKVKHSKMFVRKQRIPVKNIGEPCWALDAPNPRRCGRIPGFEQESCK